jgi:hypothetical protein
MKLDQIIAAIKDLPVEHPIVFASLEGDDLQIVFHGSQFFQATLITYITKAWHDDVSAVERETSQ